MEVSDPLSALRQQLRSDYLLGIRFVPMSPAAMESIARHGQNLISRPAEFETDPGSPRTPEQPTSHVTNVSTAAGSKSAGDAADRQARLVKLDNTQVKGCRKCILCQHRTQTVFGQGSASAGIVFVGEGPGFEEDKQGLAFVGPAGQLLTKMIGAMGLTRDEVYICNVVKCRPPQNRTPTPEEIQACHSYLREQLEIIAPEIIVTLGAPASQTLLNTGIPIGRLRGRFHDYYLSGQPGVGPAIPVMPTYHPAYLLRTPGDKGKTWEDLKMVMGKLGLPL